MNHRKSSRTLSYTYIMSAHIHTYTYVHTRIQNVHMNAHKARLKRRHGSDCAESPNLTPRSSALLPVRCNPEGDTLRDHQPNHSPRGMTDKRRTATTNSSSSHHHDSAPSRPHPIICTGAEPIHPVHCPCQLQLGRVPPKRDHFFAILAGFSGFSYQFLLHAYVCLW